MLRITYLILFQVCFIGLSAQEFNFEKIHGSEPINLLIYNQSHLLRIPYGIGHVPTIDDYEYITQIMHLHANDKRYTELASKALEQSKIIAVTPFKHYLEIPLGDKSIQFYDYDVTKLYSTDTIIVDTTLVWNCFGPDASYEPIIEILRDTIYNQIQDLNNKELYIEQFKETRMWELLKILGRIEE